MPDLIPFSEVAHLFENFEHTAWRLETRRGYASDRAGDRFRAFLDGVAPEPEPGHPWNVNVRAQTARGKRFSRVRIVDNPPTDGQRFLMATAPAGIAAGEDIRCLDRADAVRLRLPTNDLWLFDSRILARFHHDEADVTLGVELIEEPAAVLAACQARDAAWHYAHSVEEYAARVRSTV